MEVDPMAVKARSKSSRLSFLRLAYSAPAPQESIGEQVRRFTLPATKSLPFVKLRSHDQPMWRPDRFWHVLPTGKRAADIQLGRAYARKAIAAMKADHNSDLLALVLQDIIRESIERAGKTGNARLNPTVRGFLMEVSESLAVAQ
jgi:hypothetical protein